MYTSSRKKVLFIVISLLSIIGYGVFVFAAPPGVGGYNPGEILDPECAPNDPDCIVAVSGGSGWSLTGNTGTTAGTNFIGTTDTQDFVIKTNGNQIAVFGQNGNVALGSENIGFGLIVPIASGVNSFATGLQTTASGVVSTVFGVFNTASGPVSTAFGDSNIVSGPTAASFGNNNIASGRLSFITGTGNTASGYGSIAIGRDLFSRNWYQFVIGEGNTDDLTDSQIFSIGNGSVSDRHNAYTQFYDGSFAYNDDNFQNDNPGTEQNMFYFNYGNHDGLGNTNTKKAIRLGSAINNEWNINSANVGDRSVAIGFGFDDKGSPTEGPLASGFGAIALGTTAIASGDNSFALTGGIASGPGDIAFINGNASGGRSLAIGIGARSEGTDSFAFGNAYSKGIRSIAIGSGTAWSPYEIALGMYNTSYTPVSLMDYEFGDRLINVGNGNGPGFESDAFTILKNGKTGIGYDNFETTTFDSLLQVNGSILSSDITGCLFLSTDSDGKIICSTGSGFIPLSGTTPGNLVTGSIEVHSGDTFDIGNGRTIYAVASGDPDITGGFSLQDDSDLMPALWRKDHGGTTSLVIKNGSIDIDAPDHDAEIFSVTGKIRVGDPSNSIGAVATFQNTTGTCTINPTTTSLNCSSDERLKKNIEDITSTTLDTLINVKTVKYNWNSELDIDNKHIGFLAQDLQQYYPELVSVGPNGFYQVNYAGMTPILVEAIREMNLNITNLSDMTRANTWRDSLIAWFGNVENGITEFFSKKITTDELCLKDSAGTTCYTRNQLDSALSNIGTIIIPTTPISNDLTTDSSVPNDEVIDSGIPDQNSNSDIGTGGTNNTEIVTNSDIPVSE